MQWKAEEFVTVTWRKRTAVTISPVVINVEVESSKTQSRRITATLMGDPAFNL